MTTPLQFVNRLNKIGINIEFFANYPWIYLYKVNNNIVKDKYLAEHGFTCFFLTKNNAFKITDISKIFQQIRKNL